jgi:hypothetical protein
MEQPHYVYRIVNKKNNKQYIGVRSYADPHNDAYMGSSKIMNNLYRLEGVDCFAKEVLKVFSTRKEAEDWEASLLTEEFCNDPNTYNICSTGQMSDGKHGFRKELWFDYYEAIRYKYSQGDTLTNLGLYYDCDARTIAKVVADMKRTNAQAQELRYKKTITSGARNNSFDERIDEMVTLYVDNLKSLEYIANEIGCHRDVVRKRLVEVGIRIRTHKESQELRINYKRKDSKL